MTTMQSQTQVKLRWANHQGTLFSMFDLLLSSEHAVDATLAAEGQYLRAHKILLSACSPFFQELFSVTGTQPPIVFLKGVKFATLKALIHYMYRGEVNVDPGDLESLLETAQELQIRGLADFRKDVQVTETSRFDSPASSAGILHSPSGITCPPPNVINRDFASVGLSTNTSDTRGLVNTANSLLPPQLRKKPRLVTTSKAQQIHHINSFQRKTNIANQKKRPISVSSTLCTTGLQVPITLASDESVKSANRILFPNNSIPLEYVGVADEHCPSPSNQVEIQDRKDFPVDLHSELDDNIPTGEKWINSQSLVESALSHADGSSSGGANESEEILEHQINGDDVSIISRGLEDFSRGESRKRSDVWLHFNIIADKDGEIYSHCTYCGKKYKRNTSNTNLKSHLSTSHHIIVSK